MVKNKIIRLGTLVLLDLGLYPLQEPRYDASAADFLDYDLSVEQRTSRRWRTVTVALVILALWMTCVAQGELL